jgi:Protein of unknown function (DUF2878)
MRAVVNFLAFQVGWFSAVLGAGHGMPWLGIALVPLVVLLALMLAADWRGELVAIIAAAGMGVLFDTALGAARVFVPVPHLWAAPLSPPWMIVLWMNQAATMNGSLAWLRGRYVLGAIFGTIGGPLAYLGGVKLGAATAPHPNAAAILTLLWAIAFPLMMALTEWARRLPARWT